MIDTNLKSFWLDAFWLALLVVEKKGLELVVLATAGFVPWGGRGWGRLKVDEENGTESKKDQAQRPGGGTDSE